MHPSSDVTAPCGAVHGVRRDGVHVFRGIPYGLAPAGERRFALPQPVPPRDIDATRFGRISLQDVDPLPERLPGTENNFYAPGTRPGEDCLSLNIWSADLEGRAPVYVYLHGGGFLCGSGSAPWIDGTRLAAEQGLVVVTLNYRLGLLGNLWLGDYDPDAANLALQDDMLALRWVRDNIAAFGGDPDLVTVGGESAGGISVIGLLAAPGARGLFRRAVVESGHAATFLTPDEARRSTATVLRDLGIPEDGDVIGTLREVSSLRLAAVQRRHGIGLRCFPLVADGRTIDARPQKALATRAPEVDLLIGSNAEEDRLFRLTGWASGTRTIADAVSGLDDGDARLAALELYTEVQQQLALDDARIDALIATDRDWAEPVRASALLHSGAGGRTFHYELAWASAVPGVGAAHLVDLPFFFGNLDQPGVDELLGDEVRTDPATRSLADRMSSALGTFAATGDPGWPAFEPTTRASIILDREPRLVDHHLASRLDLWEAHRDPSAAPLTKMGVVA